MIKAITTQLGALTVILMLISLFAADAELRHVAANVGGVTALIWFLTT